VLERILKKVSGIVFAHYRSIAFLFVLLTAGSVYTFLKMDLRTDLIDVMPGDNPKVAQFKDFLKEYKVLEAVTVIITSETNKIDEYPEVLETLAAKFSKSPLIERVDYSVAGGKSGFFLRNFPLFLDQTAIRQLSERLSPSGIAGQIRENARKVVSPFSSPADVELIDRDPLGLREIIGASLKRSRGDRLPFDTSMGYYITKDHSAALIFLKPSGGSKDMAFVKKLRPELEAAVSSALEESGRPKGISVQLTGGHIFSNEMRQVVRHDIISSTFLSAVLIVLIIWAAYRVRPVVLAIVACTTTASLSMTLAAAYLIFGSLNIVTSIVCGLLIGMYVDYCMLTLKRYGDELLLKKDRRAALELTMTKAGAAMAVSAVTTALSFFSIVLTRFDGLHELGIVSGLGVLICFVTTLFFMSSLLVWASLSGPDRIMSVKAPVSGVEGLAALLAKHPKRFLYTSFLLIPLLLLGLTNLKFDDDPEHLGIKGSKALAALKSLNSKLSISGEPLQIIVKGKELEDLTAGFDRLEQRLAGWKSEGLLGNTDSPGSFLPPPYLQKKTLLALQDASRSRPVNLKAVEAGVAREMDRNGMSYDPQRLKAYLRTIVGALGRRTVAGLNELEDLGDWRLQRFFNRKDMSIVAYLYPKTGSWDAGVIETLRRKVAQEGPGWSLLGGAVLYPEIKTSILRGSFLAAIVTLGLNLLFIAFFLRNSRYVFYAILPVCLGSLLTPAIMGWLGAPFNFINVGTMALIFGFGVDYGVYIMQAYLREDTKDVTHALRLSGKNVMICASTTIAGCGSLITASFAGAASIGLVLTVGSVCCSTITLFLLPALLQLKDQKLNV
jgi:predicted RND superfamily exporter protein